MFGLEYDLRPYTFVPRGVRWCSACWGIPGKHHSHNEMANDDFVKLLSNFELWKYHQTSTTNNMPWEATATSPLWDTRRNKVRTPQSTRTWLSSPGLVKYFTFASFTHTSTLLGGISGLSGGSHPSERSQSLSFISFVISPSQVRTNLLLTPTRGKFWNIPDSPHSSSSLQLFGSQGLKSILLHWQDFLLNC